MNDADVPEWPIVSVSGAIEPKFIFLLTPMNSGSTAIAKMFMNSRNVGGLTANAEGQWLLKGMCASDRWNAQKYIDEKSLRSVWLKRCYDVLVSSEAEYFIEKSPPNMMRIDLLQRIFPNSILLANNRDPYASASSIFYRYTPDISMMDAAARRQRFIHIAEGWIQRSVHLQSVIIRKNVPFFRYEDFCRDPSLLQKFMDRSDFANAIELQIDQHIKVKDYDVQGIFNYNEGQISLLRSEDIDAVTAVLNENQDVLEFFNYELRNA